MAHLYRKVKKGREYFYIRETMRVHGKPATINQVYLGTADKVQALVGGERGQEGLSPKEFGSVFVLDQLERTINLAAMVDNILPPKRRTRGPSLGELVFYAVMNRAIAPTSKRRLAAWYEATDIQRIHPCRLESLSSQNFWNHWDRLDEADLERIAEAFFRQVHALLPPQEKHLLIEIANFCASPGCQQNQAQAASEGEKPGKRPLRHLGLALITERASGVPIYYQTFPGSLPEGGFFEEHLDALLAKVERLGVRIQDLTLLFSQGIASPDIVTRIDARKDLHFIAAYPPSFAPDLAQTPFEKFQPLPGRANRRLLAGGGPEQGLYYETVRQLWDRPRKVMVLFNPQAFPRQQQELQEKIKRLRRELADLQRRSRQNLGEDPAALKARYEQLCQELSLDPGLFQLGVKESNGRPELTFELRPEQLQQLERQFARTILVTDHEGWEGPDICQAYLDRCIIEAHIQDRQNPFQVALMPQYHWTDSKVRIHVFVCVAALTYLALLCHRLTAAGLLTTPKEVMQEMRALRSAIYWLPREGKFRRILASPNSAQLAILGALGFRVEDGRLLQIRKG